MEADLLVYAWKGCGESALHCLVTAMPSALFQGHGIAGCSLVQEAQLTCL